MAPSSCRSREQGLDANTTLPHNVESFEKVRFAENLKNLFGAYTYTGLKPNEMHLAAYYYGDLARAPEQSLPMMGATAVVFFVVE